MKTVLLDILKSTDKTEIDQKILDYKDGMVDRNFIDIAKNTSVKELSKYMTKSQVIGEFKKGTLTLNLTDI